MNQELAKNILNEILELSKSLKLSEPFIVGGYPRDSYIGGLKYGHDIDLTNNSGGQSVFLGLAYAKENNLRFKYFENGHLTVFAKDNLIDFSSGFKSDQVKEYLKDSILESELEVYSRDFTINMLHVKIEDFSFHDIVGQSIKDLDNKIIRTIVPPEIVFSDDSRRIFRAIYYASKLGFSIDEAIVNWIRDNKKSVKQDFYDNKTFFSNLISQSLEFDADKTIEFLLKTNIFYYVPLVGKFKNILIKNKLLSKYLEGLSNEY